ncbi:MAG: tyrosine-type recombinase/integrase [Lachnospiraceae bacterium]
MRSEDLQLLTYLQTNGIIDLDTMREKVAQMKRQECLDKHNYKIWQGKNQKWYTYLPSPQSSDGRKLIKKTTLEALQDTIVEYYKENSKSNKITLDDYFPIWKERQRACGISESSINKYDSDYIRFFKNDKIICQMDLREITSEDIERYIFRLLDRLPLKWQAFRAMFFILNEVFIKARRDKVIVSNPCEEIDINLYKRRCQDVAFIPEKRVLNDDGISKLFSVIEETKEKRPEYVAIYAAELAILTGMRAGELAFLQWKHINYNDGYILVCGSEKYNQKTKVYWDSTTKTGKERRIPLTPDIIDFFKKLKKIEEQMGCLTDYVFSDKDGRIHRNKLCTCVRDKCKQAHLEAKGLQVLRRTFNSQLKMEGVSTTVASSILGHCEEVNEKFYTYDISNMEYKTQILEKINKKCLGNHE